MTTRACPSCGGRWLYALTFDHSNDCPLRAADDATVAADYERAGLLGPVTRESTSTEVELADALGRPADPPPYTMPDDPTPIATTSYTTVVPRTVSTRRRLLRYGLDGPVWDPDNTDPESP